MNIDETNSKICEIYEGMKSLQVYKNTLYGNIGSDPINIFAKFI